MARRHSLSESRPRPQAAPGPSIAGGAAVPAQTASSAGPGRRFTESGNGKANLRVQRDRAPAARGAKAESLKGPLQPGPGASEAAGDSLSGELEGLRGPGGMGALAHPA